MAVRLKYLLSILLLLAPLCIRAQFTQQGSNVSVPGSGNTGNSVNPDSEVAADTTKLFSIGGYFRGLSHKDTLTAFPLAIGSAICIGGSQIYNRQYAKLPFIYAGIGSTLYFGIDYTKRWKETGDPLYRKAGTAFLIGAGALYWGTLLDGMINLASDAFPDSEKATMYSILLPGLGQAYNGDYWKIPIWYGALAFGGYYWHYTDNQYKRFKYVYKLAKDPNGGYVGHITADQAVYYRDKYRRYRDYSIVATIAIYALQAIDANIFAFMRDFETNDDLSFRVEPALIEDIRPYQTDYAVNSPAVGFQMKINF